MADSQNQVAEIVPPSNRGPATRVRPRHSSHLQQVALDREISAARTRRRARVATPRVGFSLGRLLSCDSRKNTSKPAPSQRDATRIQADRELHEKELRRQRKVAQRPLQSDVREPAEVVVVPDPVSDEQDVAEPHATDDNEDADSDETVDEPDDDALARLGDRSKEKRSTSQRGTVIR
ncbi:MAG: hypothetical protein Q9159_007219 [Coniocarpon cinnabarinum]